MFHRDPRPEPRGNNSHGHIGNQHGQVAIGALQTSPSPDASPIPSPDGDNLCLLKPFFRMALTHCCQTSLLSVDFPHLPARRQHLPHPAARTRAPLLGTTTHARVFPFHSLSLQVVRAGGRPRGAAAVGVWQPLACVQTT